MNEGESTLYVFPDTNVLVQCMPLGELDWSYLGDFEQILLILSRPVIGEIDQQKGGSGRLAKRARAANSLIRELLDSDSILVKTKEKRVKVIVESGNHLRPADGLDDHLDYASADDRLVGTVHRYIHDYPDREVLLLSHDTGPLMTAKRLQVPYARVPDTWLLSPESDEEQKRIRELEGQLRRYQSTEPKCEIKFEDSPWEFKVIKHRPLTDQQVAELMEQLKRRYPVEADYGPIEQQQRTVRGGLFSALFGTETFQPASVEEISNYRDELYQKWCADCEASFRELHQTLNTIEQPLIVSIALTNVGARPADDVLVQFQVKGRKFGIFSPPEGNDGKESEVPRLRPPPLAPKGKWVSDLPQLYPRVEQYRRFLSPQPATAPMFNSLLRAPVNRDPNVFYWRGGRPSNPVALVEFNCQQWRHLEDAEIFVFQLGFKLEGESIKDALAVTVHAANLAEPVQGMQKVTITVEDVDTWSNAEALLDIPKAVSLRDLGPR